MGALLALVELANLFTDGKIREFVSMSNALYRYWGVIAYMGEILMVGDGRTHSQLWFK